MSTGRKDDGDKVVEVEILRPVGVRGADKKPGDRCEVTRAEARVMLGAARPQCRIVEPQTRGGGKGSKQRADANE